MQGKYQLVVVPESGHLIQVIRMGFVNQSWCHGQLNCKNITQLALFHHAQEDCPRETTKVLMSFISRIDKIMDL